MARYITIDKKDLDKTLAAISKAQTEQRTFYNVTVKPYRGNKYDKANTVTVIVG